MKKQLLYLLVLCAFGFSCKKTELPKDSEQEQSPVFYFKGTVNGSPVKIEAGVNDYVMNASYYQEGDNLYVYKADFKQPSCISDCGFGLTILINDFQLSQPNSRMSVDSALRTIDYNFADASLNKLYYTASFSPLKAADANDHLTWTVNGQDTKTSATANYVFEAGKNYSVKLDLLTDVGCNGNLTKEFKAGNVLQTNIKLKSSSGYTCRFAAEPANSGYTYEWDFGDGKPVNHEAEPEHTYDSNSVFDYVVKLTLTDANNNSCKASYQVRPTTMCNSNFNSSFTPFINPKLLSAISLVLTDPAGNTHFSSNIQQPTNSQFEIVSVEDYKMNDKDQPTKKIKVRFNCKFDGPGGPIQITDGEAVIAVAYKK